MTVVEHYLERTPNGQVREVVKFANGLYGVLRVMSGHEAKRLFGV